MKTGAALNKLLLFEEFKAEKRISVFRAVFYALAFAEVFFVYRLKLDAGFEPLLWPFAVILLISLGLVLDLYVLGRTGLYKFFNRYSKYLIISVDVAMAVYLVYAAARENSVQASSVWSIPMLMLSASAVLIVLSLFRFHEAACYFTGALCVAAYFCYMFAIEGYSSPAELFLGNHEYNIGNAMFLWSTASLSVLGGLFARRFRNILILNEKQRNLQRFLPEGVADEVLNGDLSISTGGSRQNVTVLFSDIRNFTTFSESRPPTEVVDFLNAYFNDMIEVVFHNSGSIDKFIGDGLMAIYGVPRMSPVDAENAVRSAIDMHRKLEDLNRLRAMRGQEPVRIGVGIHSGEAIIGNIGSDRRMDFTAIGDTVNTASRLEGLTKHFGAPIVISGQTRKQLTGSFQTEKLGKVRVKGKMTALEIFRVNI